MAEAIAQARMDLEDKILDGDHAPEEWEGIVEAYLHDRPELLPYAALFRESVGLAQRANAKVEEAWREISEEEPGMSYDTMLYGAAAEKMFERLYGERPEGHITARKGKLCVIFESSDPNQDIAHVVEGGAGGVAEFERELSKPPSILTGSRGSYPAPTGLVANLIWRETVAHEAQHIKNMLQAHAKWQVAKDSVQVRTGDENSNDSALPTQVKRRLIAEVLGEGRAAKVAKHEMLSLLVKGEIYERVVADDPEEAREGMIDAVMRDVLAELIEEGSPYLAKFEDEEERKLFVRLAEHGLEAARTLRDLYFAGDRPQDSWRMTINVLEQFPPRQWPAVVRLIERDRRQREKAEAEDAPA